MADGYTLLDFGEALGQRARLEQWGAVRTVRPDPRAIGRRRLPAAEWAAADAVFDGRVGQGAWTTRRPVPDNWRVSCGGQQFEVRLAPSMHTGLFPEQAAHWAWARDALGEGSAVLNLFAYTGGASIALAGAGCRVTHVDASKPAVAWARRNAALNGLSTIRWIEDDARAFVRREGQRGRRYDALLLDPPAFGRARTGVWRLDGDLEPLLDQAIGLLSPAARLILVNAYDSSTTSVALAGLLGDLLARRDHPLARVDPAAGSLDLRTADGRTLPTGVFARVRTGPPHNP